MPDPITPTETQVVTPPDAATPTDSEEWDDAIKDSYPNLLEGKKDDSDDDGDDDPKDKKEDPKADSPAEDPKPEDAPKPADAPASETPKEPAAQTNADLRATQREMAQEFDTVKHDVAIELFKDLPLELKDADGDPIRGVEDAMKLIDPRTGESFTEESATTWFLQAKANLQQSINDADREADRITSINISLKDDADRLQREFGEILKTNPDAMKQVWDEYSKTLQLSPSGKVVVNAPVSLYSFAKTAISPYVTVAQAQAEAAQAKQAVEKAQRSQNRQSRSDIFGSGKVDNLSEDDKEWADAAKEYYEK